MSVNLDGWTWIWSYELYFMEFTILFLCACQATLQEMTHTAEFQCPAVLANGVCLQYFYSRVSNLQSIVCTLMSLECYTDELTNKYRRRMQSVGTLRDWGMSLYCDKKQSVEPSIEVMIVIIFTIVFQLSHWCEWLLLMVVQSSLGLSTIS